MEHIIESRNQMNNLKKMKEEIMKALNQDIRMYFKNVMESIATKDESLVIDDSGYHNITLEKKVNKWNSEPIILVLFDVNPIYDKEYETGVNHIVNLNIRTTFDSNNFERISQFNSTFSYPDFESAISHNLNLLNIYSLKVATHEQSFSNFCQEYINSQIEEMITLCKSEEGLNISQNERYRGGWWQIKKSEGVFPKNIKITKEINKRNIQVTIQETSGVEIFSITKANLEEYLYGIIRKDFMTF